MFQSEVINMMRGVGQEKRYWLKCDGSDLKICLQETKEGKWFGDVNIKDEDLEKLKLERKNREENLDDIRAYLEDDVDFLMKGYQQSCRKLASKKSQSGVAESTIIGLTWDCNDFSCLLAEAQRFLVSISVYCDSSKKVKVYYVLFTGKTIPIQ